MSQGPTKMGASWKRLPLLAVLLTSCTAKYAPTMLVEGLPPRVGEPQRWYDAEELDRIVREYVREKKVDFDFRGTAPQFWVPRDQSCLTEASYSSKFGMPTLSAKIGWDGRVIEHYLAISVEGRIGDPAVK